MIRRLSGSAAVGRFGNLDGAQTAAVVREHYRGHDRLVVLTDEQAWAGSAGVDPTGQVPDSAPVHLEPGGYRVGHGPSGEANRHTFGGLLDAGFAMIPLLEAGQTGHGPF